MYYNYIMSSNKEKIYMFVKNQILINGYPPTVREICDEIGLKSTSSAQYHLKLLEEEGRLNKTKSKSRTLNIGSHHNSNFSVPLLGEISAGDPLIAEELNIGSISIPDTYQTKNDIFALKISGDSMIDAGIYDKDTVVIEKTKDIINNDIVAALVNNESTIKHYRIIDGKSFLVPANKNYKPKRLDESCEIVGKVICLFRDM